MLMEQKKREKLLWIIWKTSNKVLHSKTIILLNQNLGQQNQEDRVNWNKLSNSIVIVLSVRTAKVETRDIQDASSRRFRLHLEYLRSFFHQRIFSFDRRWDRRPKTSAAEGRLPKGLSRFLPSRHGNPFALELLHFDQQFLGLQV